MSTEDIISARRDAAIQKWTEAVFAMYPFETTGFIRTQRDQFANPVGHATRAAGEQIYDAVTGRDVDMEKVHASVAALIRIRAVQDLKPEQAVGVLYLYKSVLRELLPGHGRRGCPGVPGHGDRLDAFNLYLADREQVYAERVGPTAQGSVSDRGAGRPDMAWWKIRTGNRPSPFGPFYWVTDLVALE